MCVNLISPSSLLPTEQVMHTNWISLARQHGMDWDGEQFHHTTQIDINHKYINHLFYNSQLIFLDQS